MLCTFVRPNPPTLRVRIPPLPDWTGRAGHGLDRIQRVRPLLGVQAAPGSELWPCRARERYNLSPFRRVGRPTLILRVNCDQGQGLDQARDWTARRTPAVGPKARAGRDWTGVARPGRTGRRVGTTAGISSSWPVLAVLDRAVRSLPSSEQGGHLSIKARALTTPTQPPPTHQTTQGPVGSSVRRVRKAQEHFAPASSKSLRPCTLS